MSFSRYRRGSAGTVAAAGTVQGNATLLSAEINLVTGADGAKGVILPTPTPGGPPIIVVNNEAAQNLLIYPASGGEINEVGDDMAFTLSGGQTVVLYPYTATQWYGIGAVSGLSDVEMAYLDGVTAGTGLASKALVLDSSGNVAMPAAPASIDERNAEVVITTNVIAASENGRTFYLNLAAGFTSTLPAPALGLRFRFIVKTAPTGAAYVITTNGSANIMYGMMLERAGGAGVAGAARDTFNFIHNQSIAGDWVEFWSDGTNWYYHGMVDVAAGNTVAAT
jgi:hypothetical protein